MQQRPRNLFQVLFGAGGDALNMGAQLAPQMYQQKMGQQRDQRDFDATQQYRQQQMAQDESQFGRQLDAQNERARISDWQNRAKTGVNYGDMTDEAKILLGRQYGLIPSGYKQPNEGREQTVQNPPSMFDVYNTAYGKAESARRQKEEGWRKDPMNWVDHNTMVPFPDKPVDQEAVWQGAIGSMIPNWRAKYGSDVFGDNAADSGRGLVGLPPMQPPPQQGQGNGPMTRVNMAPDASYPIPPQDWPGTNEEWVDYMNRKRGIK